jgi:hypothetical protein
MLTINPNLFWLVPDIMSVAFMLWVLWMFRRDEKRQNGPRKWM